MGNRVASLASLTITVAFLAAASADAAVLATVAPSRGATAPALWNGGVAWDQVDGVFAASPAAPLHRLLTWKGYAGFPGKFSLDAGDPASGALGAGFFEVNDQTPPMGPGDDLVPAPAIPYGDEVGDRALIGADGTVTRLPNCGADAAFLAAGAVSLAGSSVAYACTGAPPGSPKSQFPDLLSYVALADAGAPTTPTGTRAGLDGAFQLSGRYLAYYRMGADATTPGATVVEDLSTSSVAYAVPGFGGPIALQADGTMVLLVAPSGVCKTAGHDLAEWFSVASPVAHSLGCFDGGSERPVGGRWVGVAATGKSTATLETVDLATAATRPLATLADGVMFRGADFDGQQLAWAVESCAGTLVEHVDDVDATAAPQAFGDRCPVTFHSPQTLRLSTLGTVRIAIVCRAGCPIASVSVQHPSKLAHGSPAAELAPSTTPHSFTIHFTRAQRAYLSRHRRIHITVHAYVAGVGLSGSVATRTFTLHTR